MATQTGDEPDPLLPFHERLLAGDRTASEALARGLLGPVVQSVRAKFRHEGDDFVEQVAADAVLDYLEHPAKFNRDGRKSLTRYVQMIAGGDAINLYRKQKRQRDQRRKAEKDLKIIAKRVADDPSAGKSSGEEFEAILKQVPDERDRAYLRLYFDGVKADDLLAEALGLGHLSADEKKAAVKRARDRILAALRRKRRA